MQMGELTNTKQQTLDTTLMEVGKLYDLTGVHPESDKGLMYAALLNGQNTGFSLYAIEIKPYIYSLGNYASQATSGYANVN
jgi:hypothetical protein